MSKQIRQVLGKPSARGGRARRARGLRSLWVSGLLTAALLVGIYVWQRVNTRPTIVQAISETEGGDPLLPLAAPVKPLRGTHDMSVLPAQVPQPEAVPEGTEVPRVDIPQASFDFGLIPPRPPVAYVFAIQNTGTAPLILSSLATSCGCTVAELSSSVIPPGQRANLQVTFDPDFHETRGEVTRVVWMVTNDPTQPWLEIVLKADVQAP
jgi:hypothetical protein